MEGDTKRRAREKWGGILGLARRIPQRDVRRLLWTYLNADDREVVRCAHNSRRAPALEAGHEERFVRRGHLALLRWSFASFDNVSRLRTLAARCGHLDILQWLTDGGRIWSAYLCGVAAKNSHLHILKWAHACGAYNVDRDDGGVAWHAAYHGHLEILVWYHSIGGGLDSAVFRAAARYGSLEVMQWLRSVGCPWDERVRKVATGEALVWLEQNGCPPYY